MREDKYSVEEIADRICTYGEDYRNNLLNGRNITVSARGDLKYFVIRGIKSMKIKVQKGDLLGTLCTEYKWNYDFSHTIKPMGIKEEIEIPASGVLMFEFLTNTEYNGYNNKAYQDEDKDYLFELDEKEFFPKGTVAIGRIYLPEHDFYMDNKAEIDELVKIKLSTKEMELQKRIETQENADKLLKKQNTSLENIDTLLTELDKYILDNKLPVIETFQAINDDLKTLYEQKENSSNIKFIKDYESHFENAYIESKKNPNLTDIIEQRMLGILRTFFEISGETEDNISIKLDDIKKAGDDKKFSIDFEKHVEELDESVVRILSSYANNKNIDYEELKRIERISIFFTDPKSRMNQVKKLEGSKDCIESVWREYSKSENKSSSVEESLKRVLSNLYEAFGNTAENVGLVFEKYEAAETIKKITSQILELENAVGTNLQIKVDALQNIADSIKDLAKQKDSIQDKSEVESNKLHFAAIYKDCKKRKDFSSSMKLRMQEILDGFDELLGKKKGRFWK